MDSKIINISVRTIPRTDISFYLDYFTLTHLCQKWPVQARHFYRKDLLIEMVKNKPILLLIMIKYMTLTGIQPKIHWLD